MTISCKPGSKWSFNVLKLLTFQTKGGNPPLNHSKVAVDIFLMHKHDIGTSGKLKVSNSWYEGKHNFCYSYKTQQSHIATLTFVFSQSSFQHAMRDHISAVLIAVQWLAWVTQAVMTLKLVASKLVEQPRWENGKNAVFLSSASVQQQTCWQHISHNHQFSTVGFHSSAMEWNMALTFAAMWLLWVCNTWDSSSHASVL